MIILILLILLSRNKYCNVFSTNNYLFLFFILFLFSSNCNINSNLYTFENIYSNPNVSQNNKHCNSQKSCKKNHKNNFHPSYNGTNISQNIFTEITTDDANEYYNREHSNNYMDNCNYHGYTKQHLLSSENNKRTTSIDTISSKNFSKPHTKHSYSNVLNKPSLSKSIQKSTTIDSLINKNINENNFITITPIKKNETYSLSCINKINTNLPIIVKNISKGETITVIIKDFGSITGKLISSFNEVISLKLDDNRTLFINSNFISYYY